MSGEDPSRMPVCPFETDRAADQVSGSLARAVGQQNVFEIESPVESVRKNQVVGY
jgi:hypothetical protein